MSNNNIAKGSGVKKGEDLQTMADQDGAAKGSSTNKTSLLYSIKTKFTVFILLFVGILMLSVLTFLERSVGEAILKESIEKGLSLANGISASSEDPLLTDDDLALFSIVKRTMRSRGIAYAIIVDSDGIIKAHNDTQYTGERYAPEGGSDILQAGNGYSVSYLERDGGIYNAAVEISSEHLGGTIGWAHIGISSTVVKEAVEEVRASIKSLTYLALVIAGLGAFLLATIIVQPIGKISEGALAIGQGRLEHRIDVNRKDELGTLMENFNNMAEGLKQKQFLTESFGRYVAPEVVDMILSNEEAWLKGKKVDVTVFFSDIRGFTSFSENKDPEFVISLLNDYFTVMTDIIQKNGGYIDKFIGDAVMAVFGSPIGDPQHAIHAVTAACEIQENFANYNKDRGEASKLEVGIGLNSGEVFAGNLGSDQKMEYAVIGDNVNTASRVCDKAGRGEVVVAKSTYEAVQNLFALEELPPVALKGKSEPLEVWSIIPRRGPDRKDDFDISERKG